MENDGLIELDKQLERRADENFERTMRTDFESFCSYAIEYSDVLESFDKIQRLLNQYGWVNSSIEDVIKDEL